MSSPGRYSTGLLRVLPQELNQTIKKHASHNHDDGQNPEPHSRQTRNIRDVVTASNARPEVTEPGFCIRFTERLYMISVSIRSVLPSCVFALTKS
jgi:hypothetical protein